MSINFTMKLKDLFELDFFDESSDLVKISQDNSFNHNKLTNLDGITVNRSPSSDNELANKKYVDD